MLQDWIAKVNAKFKVEKRHIVLLLDNAPTHLIVDVPKHTVQGFQLYYLSNVTVIFLPANTTSLVQPLDQGIIAAFKARYRRHLVRATLAALEKDDDLTIAKIKPNMLEVLKWVRWSAKALTPETIRNCWFKADILGTDKVPTPPPRSVRRHIARHGHAAGAAAMEHTDADDDDEEVVEGLDGEADNMEALQTDLEQLALAVRRRPGALETGDSIITAGDYGHLAGEEETFEELTEDEIVELVMSEQQDGLADEDDTDPVGVAVQKATLPECVQMLEAVEVALEDHAFFGMDDADTLHDLSQRVLRVVMRHSKQGNLNDFLNI